MGIWILGAVPSGCSTFSHGSMKLSRSCKKVAILVLCAAASLACSRKVETDGSDAGRTRQACPRPGTLYAERGAYLHGETGIRRGIAEPLRWLDEGPLMTHDSYRWVN